MLTSGESDATRTRTPAAALGRCVEASLIPDDARAAWSCLPRRTLPAMLSASEQDCQNDNNDNSDDTDDKACCANYGPRNRWCRGIRVHYILRLNLSEMSVHNFKQRKKYIFRFAQLLRQFLFHALYMMIVIQVTLVRQLYPLLFWHEAAFCKIFLCCTITSPRKVSNMFLRIPVTYKHVLFSRGRDCWAVHMRPGENVSLRFLDCLAPSTGPFHTTA